MIHRFEEVRHRVSKIVPCRGCGKKLKRSTTLSQTLNPFNKTKGGVVKSEAMIRDELRAEAKTWHPVNDVCPECEEEPSP